MGADAIVEKVRKWLSSEGIQFTEQTDNRADLHLLIKYPSGENGHKFAIVIPKGRDLIAISSMTRVDGGQQESMSKLMTEDQEEWKNWLHECRMQLMASGVDWGIHLGHDGKTRPGPLQAFNVSEPIWFDGLTKNEMMQKSLNREAQALRYKIEQIQSNKQFRQDIVTIILRLVNVQTGEVVITTTVEKTIVSTMTGGDIFKYFDTDTMLLEVEAGYAKNEPVTFAIRKAIEKGVVDLIIEGVDKGLWEFDIEVADVPEIKDYLDNTNGVENGIHIDIGEKMPEKTYEDYLKEKEEREKNLTSTEKELVEEAQEKEWDNLETEENADEKDNDDASDSSSDNN